LTPFTVGAQNGNKELASPVLSVDCERNLPSGALARHVTDDAPPGIDVRLTEVRLSAVEQAPGWSLLAWLACAVGSAWLFVVGGPVLGPLLVIALVALTFGAERTSRTRQILILTPDEVREEAWRFGSLLYEKSASLAEIESAQVVRRELVVTFMGTSIVIDELNASIPAMTWMADRIEEAVAERHETGREVSPVQSPPRALRNLMEEP